MRKSFIIDTAKLEKNKLIKAAKMSNCPKKEDLIATKTLSTKR